MPLNRRHFLQSSLSVSLGLALGSRHALAAEEATARRYVINGNMVIEPEFGDPLDDATKAKLRRTDLTAFKLSLGGSKGTPEEAHEILDSLPEIYSANPDVFMHINSGQDLIKAYDSKRIGIIYSFEAATMLEGNVDKIREFAERGVRIMQLGYNHTSPFGAGVMSVDEPLGLSKLGHQAVAAMEQNKVLLDLSHAHQFTSIDALKASTRPVAMTHTGCDAINKHQRNKSDQVLKATADSGGVVGIYEMSYLTPDLKQQSLDAFMAHILHAVKVCGEDHVGIGSDTPALGFDTGPESMAMWNKINRIRAETGVAAPGEGPPPYVVGLNGPHKMQAIAKELGIRGLKASAIDKILGGNFARLFTEVW